MTFCVFSCQVNIDYVTRKEIVDTLGPSDSTLTHALVNALPPPPLPITVFDRAEREIVRLMASDPFVRFKSRKMEEEEFEQCATHSRLNSETRSRGCVLRRTDVLRPKRISPQPCIVIRVQNTGRWVNRELDGEKE